MSAPHIGISHEAWIPEETFKEILSAVHTEELGLRIEGREEEGPYAGLEWLLPTAVIVFVARSYFDEFLKEMGKDHYALLKKGLKSLWNKMIGPSSPKIVLVSSPQSKGSRNQRYSCVFSVVAEAGAGAQFKLLVQNELSQSEYEEIVDSFLSFLETFHDAALDPETTEKLQSARAVGGTLLLAYNQEKNVIEPVDPIPNQSFGEQE